MFGGVFMGSSLPYKIRLCGISKVKSVYSLDSSNEYYDITSVYSGTLHYRIDDKEYILKKGDTIIIPPGSHCVRYPGNKPANYFVLNYYSDGEMEKEMPTLIQSSSGSLNSVTRLIVQTYHKSSKKTTPYHDEKCSLAVNFLILELMEQAKVRKYSPHIQQIMNYITEHITEPIQLSEISEKVFLSVPHCCYIVKSELGTTIHELIVRERIALAQNYLISGDFPLREIPYLCGFNDYNSFYKSFKKHTGISPSKFK